MPVQQWLATHHLSAWECYLSFHFTYQPLRALHFLNSCLSYAQFAFWASTFMSAFEGFLFSFESSHMPNKVVRLCVCCLCDTLFNACSQRIFQKQRYQRHSKHFIGQPSKHFCITGLAVQQTWLHTEATMICLNFSKTIFLNTTLQCCSNARLCHLAKF